MPREREKFLSLLEKQEIKQMPGDFFYHFFVVSFGVNCSQSEMEIILILKRVFRLKLFINFDDGLLYNMPGGVDLNQILYTSVLMKLNI